MQYRVGRQLTWPLTEETPSADVVCSDELFRLSETSGLGLPFRSLVSRQKYNTSAVACNVDAWYHLNGSNSDRQQVEGFINACGNDVTQFKYLTRMTSPTRDQSLTSETHRCLATFIERSHMTEFTYIITAEVVSEPSEPPPLRCWLLQNSVSLRNPRLYLMHAADCHGDISASYTGYIAQFDLMYSETDQEWVRNCSSSHQVPVITPGPNTPSRSVFSVVSTPGPGSTVFSSTVVVTESSASTLITNSAAAVATAVTLIINRMMFKF